MLIGNNTNPIITTSNLMWNNNLLTINGNINANNIYVNNNISAKIIQGQFIGDGANISNIGATNLIGVVSVANGGIGTSFINSGRILFGNNTNPINSSPNFIWNNSLNTLTLAGSLYVTNVTANNSIFCPTMNIISSIIANNGTFTNVYGSSIQGKLYGDGNNISNIIASNIIGILSVSNGGTGCNTIPYGQLIIGNNTNSIIATSNLLWDQYNNILTVKGNINANNINIGQNIYANIIQGKFYGDGTNISNIIASNIIPDGNTIIQVNNGGTGCSYFTSNQILIGNNSNPIYTTSNLTWDSYNNILNVNGTINTNTFITSGSIYSSNINIINNITSTNASINNIYANNIQGTFIGDGSGLSNIVLNNINGILKVSNGGTGCSSLPNNQLLIGNNINPIYTTPNLIWNNQQLVINGDIYTNNIYSTSNLYTETIQGKFYGDGTNISNIIASNLIGTGIIPISNGGTGCSSFTINNVLVGNNTSPLITSPYFIWNNSLNSLNITGSIYATIINTTNLFASVLNITNTLSVNKGNFNTSISANTIQANNILGDGSGLSNIIASNLIGILSVSNGGTGCNSFISGQILIGNNSNPIITTSNLVWNQYTNNLIINGNINVSNINTNNIYANSIYGNYYGDGTNISNIVASNIIGSSLVSVSNGGTGAISFPSTQILFGNGTNPLGTAANFTWSGNSLYLTGGTIYATNMNLSSTLYSLNTSITNTLVANKGTFNASIYSPLIQGIFYGDGTNISNIIGSNIISPISVANGGTGCNIIPFGQLLIGNNNNPIITTSNLLWANNTLNITGNIITSNINITDTLTVNNIQTSNLNIIGWNSTNNTYYGIKNNNPFYISLYLTNNINSISTTFAIPFTVNYNTNGGMIGSSSNIEPSIWNTDHFIVPIKGLYSINYSAMSSSANYYIWLNKSSDFANNNRFGVQNGFSTSIIINSLVNDSWYFIIYNGGNLLVNNIGTTKASISLLQEIQ